MARPFNLAANPVRLLLALALLFLGALLVGFSVNQPPSSNAGSRSQPPSMFATAPNTGPLPAANAATDQSTSATTRIVTPSSQTVPLPAVNAAGTNTAPAQSEPVQPGCGAGGPPAAPGIASLCPGG